MGKQQTAREQTVSEAYGLPPVLVGQIGSEFGDAAARQWELATGRWPAPDVAWRPEGLTCAIDRYNAPAIAAHRAEHSHPCAVPWCGQPAVWSWQRTQAELRDMYRGKRWADTRESWETVREVCDVHKPHWRADVYVPLGQVRSAAPAPSAKPRARKVEPAPAPSGGPALSAALDELAETRAQLEALRAKLERQVEAGRAADALHSETWAALAARAEELRQARAELADLRASLAAPLSAPADMLAELVA